MEKYKVAIENIEQLIKSCGFNLYSEDIKLIKELFNSYENILDEYISLKDSQDPYYKPEGVYEVRKILNGKAPAYYYSLTEIELEYGDAPKLADYAIALGFDVIYDEDEEYWIISGMYHWDDGYFYPYHLDE